MKTMEYFNAQLLILFLCTFMALGSLATAKWPPPGQVCPCRCSLSQDPQITYVLGPGQYKQVDCRGLGLREIPSDFPLDTQVVLLNNNNIASLIQDNLDDIRSLIYLDISNNAVTSVPRDTFTYNVKLRVLNLGYNRISRVANNAFTPLKQLTHLAMTANSLSGIPNAVGNLPLLLHLDLAKNSVTQIGRTSLQRLPQLKILNLQENSISYVDANVLRQLPKLVSVLLTQNQISYLPNYMFRGLQNLDHVALGKNKIVNLPGIIFRGAPKLRKIDLHQNRLTYLDPMLFTGMYFLEEINLNQNRLLTLPPGIFQGLRNLGVIDIAGNPQMRTLPAGIFRGLPMLEEVEVSHLEIIPEGLFWGLYNIEGLSVTDSNVTPPVLLSMFRDISRLQELKLSNNGITEIPSSLFQKLAQLESIDLSTNRISQFSMDWFGGNTMINLAYVNIGNNNIEMLPPEAFAQMPKLQELNLEGNKIGEINENIFAYGTQLDTVKLSNNKIRHVEQGALMKLLNVEKFTITNNRLTCDCHLRPFAEWLRSHIDIVENPNEIVCASPKYYSGRQIIQLLNTQRSPFNCVYPSIVTRPRHIIMNMNIGQSTEMYCQLSDTAVADIIWTLPDGTELKTPFEDVYVPGGRSRIYTKASGSLVVQNVVRSDEGTYSCRSVNSVGTDEIRYDMRLFLPVVPVTENPPIRPGAPTPPKTTKPPVKTTPKPRTAVPPNAPSITTANPAPATVRPGGRVTSGQSGGVAVTAKEGSRVDRTTLRLFTLPPTTLPPSPCNPNPCKHGGTCKVVLKSSSTESDEEESQESYSSSIAKQQGERIYNAAVPTVPSEKYTHVCTCRKKWGGPECQFRKPEMPRTVKIIEVDANLITLTWSAIANIQGYRILYSKVGDRTVVKSMPIHPQVSSYTMEKLSNDATYRVCVVAFNNGGESSIGEQNCIWAETSSGASGLASIFNVQLIAIGGGCLILLVLLVTSLYCYQRMQKKREDGIIDENLLVTQPGPRPQSSAGEMIRRSMRSPTFSNQDDVMLIDLANQSSPHREMYMNAFDSNRHSVLFPGLDRSSGSLSFSDRLFPRANPRNTLKIQDDTQL